MGKSLVFVSDGCAGSQLVRELFFRYDIAFEEIDVDRYPERRAWMIKWTNRLTTPQVFVDDRHLGDETALASILKRYDDRSIPTTTTITTTTKKRLERSNLDPKLTASQFVSEHVSHDPKPLPAPKGEKRHHGNIAATTSTSISTRRRERLDRTRIHDFISVAEGRESTVGAVTRDLLERLPRRKHPADRRFLRSSPMKKEVDHASGSRCFTGEDAVRTFMGHYHLSSVADSLALGQKLLELGIIHRIDNGGLVSDLFSHEGRYCIQPLRRPLLLNSFRIFTTDTGLGQLRPDDGPVQTLAECVRWLGEVLDSATDYRGEVDYNAAGRDARFRAFEEIVCQLQLVDLDRMATEEEGVRKTYFINVYNLLLHHAMVRFARHKNKNDDGGKKKHRSKTIPEACYDIGGHVFGLDDIRYGILLGNSVSPAAQKPPFCKSDPRARFALHNIDARIHFALLPHFSHRTHQKKKTHSHNQQQQQQQHHHDRVTSLYEYHFEALHEELRVAAERYCRSDARVRINPVDHEVVLPKFMRPLPDDIGDDLRPLLERIVGYLRTDPRRQSQLQTMLDQERSSLDPTGGNSRRKIVVRFEHEKVPSSRRRIKGNRIVGLLRCGRRFRPHRRHKNAYSCLDDDAVDAGAFPVRRPLPQPTVVPPPQQHSTKSIAVDGSSLRHIHIEEDDGGDKWDTVSVLSSLTHSNNHNNNNRGGGGGVWCGGGGRWCVDIEQDDNDSHCLKGPGMEDDPPRASGSTAEESFFLYSSHDESVGDDGGYTIDSCCGRSEQRERPDEGVSSPSERLDAGEDADLEIGRGYPLRKIPSEFTFSDIPDDYSMRSRSVMNSTLPPPRNVNELSCTTSRIPTTEYTDDALPNYDPVPNLAKDVSVETTAGTNDVLPKRISVPNLTDDVSAGATSKGPRSNPSPALDAKSSECEKRTWSGFPATDDRSTTTRSTHISFDIGTPPRYDEDDSTEEGRKIKVFGTNTIRRTHSSEFTFADVADDYSMRSESRSSINPPPLPRSVFGCRPSRAASSTAGTKNTLKSFDDGTGATGTPADPEHDGRASSNFPDDHSTATYNLSSTTEANARSLDRHSSAPSMTEVTTELNSLFDTLFDSR